MAQTPEEVTSWDVLANGKEYTVIGPGIWSEDDGAYLFQEVDYEQTFSLNEEAEQLTIAQIRELRSGNATDDEVNTQIQILRTVSVHEVETNGEYLDYLGTIRGKHDIRLQEPRNSQIRQRHRPPRLQQKPDVDTHAAGKGISGQLTINN